jgi:hypothetical protein
VKELSEVILIDKDEAEIINRALHHYLFDVQLKGKKKIGKEDMIINKLYEEIRSFVRSFTDWSED